MAEIIVKDIDPQLKNDFKKITIDEETSMSEVIRDCITEYVKKHKLTKVY